MKAMRRFWVLFALFGLTACEGQKEIVSALDEFEANEILVVLDSQGISGEKKQAEGRNVTFAVTVKNSTVPQALKVLVDNHLPHRKLVSFEQIYPPGSAGLIPTHSEEKARFLMGQQGEIEKMLMILPGVVRAKGSIVLPHHSVIRDINAPTQRATASVAIVYNTLAHQEYPAITEDQVKKLVSASVEDLDPSGVTVVMKRNVPVAFVEMDPDLKATLIAEAKEVADIKSELASGVGRSVLAPAASEQRAKVIAPVVVDTSELDSLRAESSKNFNLVVVFALIALIALVLAVWIFLRARKGANGAALPAKACIPPPPV